MYIDNGYRYRYVRTVLVVSICWSQTGVDKLFHTHRFGVVEQLKTASKQCSRYVRTHGA